jgi:outer membrane protein OmpA-like peptidoglycan-associated protein
MKAYSFGLLLLAGCASTPSPDLREARSAYAVTTTNAVVDPGPLTAARDALDRAERKKRDPTLAYVALRKVEIAESAVRVEAAHHTVRQEERALENVDQDAVRSGKRAPATTDEALVYTAGSLERERIKQQNEEREAGQVVDRLHRVARVKDEPGGFAAFIPAARLFSDDKVALGDQPSELDAIALAIVRTASHDIVMVECHADTPDRGDAHDEHVAQLRADAVADYLASRGVARAQIQAVGLRPKHYDPNAASLHGLERRVDITVHPTE